MNIREHECADQLQYLLERMAAIPRESRHEVYRYWATRRLLRVTDCAVFEEWVRRLDGKVKNTG